MSSIFQLSELSIVRLDLLSLYFFEFSRYAASDQTLLLLGNRESLVCQLVGQFILQSLGGLRLFVLADLEISRIFGSSSSPTILHFGYVKFILPYRSTFVSLQIENNNENALMCKRVNVLVTIKTTTKTG